MLKNILLLLDAVVKFLVTLAMMGVSLYMLAALMRLGLGWWRPSTEEAVRVILTLVLITALNTLWLPRDVREIKEMNDETNLNRAAEQLRPWRCE